MPEAEALKYGPKGSPEFRGAMQHLRTPEGGEHDRAAYCKAKAGGTGNGKFRGCMAHWQFKGRKKHAFTADDLALLAGAGGVASTAAPAAARKFLPGNRPAAGVAGALRGGAIGGMFGVPLAVAALRANPVGPLAVPGTLAAAPIALGALLGGIRGYRSTPEKTASEEDVQTPEAVLDNMNVGDPGAEDNETVQPPTTEETKKTYLLAKKAGLLRPLFGVKRSADPRNLAAEMAARAGTPQGLLNAALKKKAT